ncbi:MAG: hypothetical protein KIT19_10270 [Phycisphaeraceae bacterium]|nr:hypothetical protein [Phycisphaeraceae bacterium]
MATDGQAFNKVKSLLNRMDRSIEEARDKRLGKSHTDGPLIGAGQPASSVVPAPSAAQEQRVGTSGSTLIGASTTPPMTIASPSPAASPEPSKSGYGRAKPLARPTSPDNSARRWGT